MTDGELRASGQRFIDQRRVFIEHGTAYSPTEKVKALACWEFIDPLRMGIYLLVAGKNGAFAIDSEHIAQVCTNPSAFKQTPPADAERVGSFASAELPGTGPLLTDDGRLADCVLAPDTLADGTPLDAFKAPELF